MSTDTTPRPKSTGPEILTGSGAILRSLEHLGITDVFGLPGRRDHAVLRRAHGVDRHPPHPRAPRAGRGPRGRGLRLVERQGRRRDRDERPRRDQPRDGDRGCPHGLGAAARDHRPGLLDLDGNRRVPGGRHRRHHDADHEALVPRDASRGRAGDDRRGRTTSPRPAAPAPCSSTSRRTPSRRARRSSGRPRSTCPATARCSRPTASRCRPRPSCSPSRERPVLYVGGGVIRAGRIEGAVRLRRPRSALRS